MKIGVIGTGYVGLVSGVMLAKLGHEVVCIDSDVNKINKLNNGECTIYEDGLEENLRSVLNSGSIKFFHSYEKLQACEAVLICVGTPASSDGSANLSFVKEALEKCVLNTNEGSLIIIKSTIPPGCARILQDFLTELRVKHEIASNPEFLREGSAVYDFDNPDRIVVGVASDLARKIFEKIYEKKVNEGVPLLVTDTTTAEMIKYTSNSFLAIKLSFINEMSNLCEKLEADVEKLSEGVGLDKRIGSLFLKAGPGYGGSCFPKDTSALSMLAKALGCKSAVLDAAISSNLSRYEIMKNKIKRFSAGKDISILGVAFKANTDDVRESPAVEIIKLLLEEGYRISVYDPAAHENFRQLGLKGAECFYSIKSCCIRANAVVILTEWEEFSRIDWREIAGVVSDKTLIDLRKVACEKDVKAAGFDYYTLGRAGRS